MNIETSLSDESLIELAQKGNGLAYDKLFERYQGKIRQMIYFYTHDWTSVNDLTQEVLIKVFRHLPYFNERSQFSTWLYKITQNTIKNFFAPIIFMLIQKCSMWMNNFLHHIIPQSQT